MMFGFARSWKFQMKKIPVRHIKPTLQEPDITGGFVIRDVKEMLEGKDMVQALHRHDFFFILALQKGVGSHEIDFITYEVVDNSVFFMRPGQVHQLVLKTGSEGYLIQFDPNFYEVQNNTGIQLLRKISNNNLYQLDINKFMKTGKMLSYIFNEFNDKEAGYQESIKWGLNIFFTELGRHLHSKEAPPNGVSTYIQEQLEHFLALLDMHIATIKQVSHYAKMMNISIYQLNSITKILLDNPPSELINESIILECKRNLLATSSQITQIAEKLGYEDVSYFIRFFKKHTGHSPQAFRDNYK